MLSNLLGFDVEAELRGVATRNWIRKEEKELQEMEKRGYVELESGDDFEEDEGDTEKLDVVEIFKKAATEVLNNNE